MERPRTRQQYTHFNLALPMVMYVFQIIFIYIKIRISEGIFHAYGKKIEAEKKYTSPHCVKH